jgi:hypothetical protein
VLLVAAAMVVAVAAAVMSPRLYAMA